MEDQPCLRFEAKKGKQITASDLSHPIQKLMSQGGQCYKNTAANAVLLFCFAYVLL